MKAWVGKALALLAASLEPPRHELNELDWKAALSPDKKRLTEHLSALANYPGGGYLVFGVDNSGIPLGINEDTVEYCRVGERQLAHRLPRLHQPTPATGKCRDTSAPRDLETNTSLR